MSSCVLDTDVLIAVLDRSDVHHEQAADAVRTMLREQVSLVLSLINYAETLVRPAQDAQSLRVAVTAIEAMAIRLVAPTAQIAREAARLRGFNISLADGFALATARAHGASVATFDRRVRRSLKRAELELAPALR